MRGLAASPLYLVTGAVVGWLYFGGVWLNTQRLVAGGRVLSSVALMIGRFALLGGLLFLASRQGAMPLLAMASGVMLARFVVMRRVRAGP